MRSSDWLTTDQVSTIFAEEISARGGTVHDTFDDGAALFARSILPQLAEILPGDRVQGGVAIRASEQEIFVHPYTFRLVCSNGAISAHATQTRHIKIGASTDPVHVEWALREAVQLCCAPEAFSNSAEEMRSAAGVRVDLLLTLIPMLSRLPAELGSSIISELMGHVIDTNPHDSRYKLMNVVTATARDTRDPEAKWRLEELGGAIAAGQIPTPQHDLAIAEHESTETTVRAWQRRVCAPAVAA
jgi:hypothetical protein